MYIRIFTSPCNFSLLFFPSDQVDLVFHSCLLPVCHLVGASGPSHDDFSTCPSPPSHPSLSRPIPSLLLTILGDLHCKLSSLPHFRSRISIFFFFSSFIQPASEGEQPALQDLPSSTVGSSIQGATTDPEDPFQHRRRVVLTSLHRL